MERLREGKIYSGTVEGYTSEGQGVVRLDGAVVFVPGTIRGEEIDLRITKVMKTAAAGELVKLRTPSPERTAPECPQFGRCGGCQFQHMSYQEELWAKRQRVEDALRRLGGSDVPIEGILGAKDPLHYRNKSQYPVGADGSIGFYQLRSHKVVPIRRCLIQSEVSDAAAEAVGAWMRRYKVPPYDETTGKGLVRHIYVRVNRKGESLCCVVVNGRQVPREPELAALIRAAAPKTVGVVLNSNTRRGNVILGEKYRTLWGQDFLMDSLCGLTFKLSVPSFYQVNRDQAEVLYGRALEYAALTGEETVLDLYCGTGTITLWPSARRSCPPPSPTPGRTLSAMASGTPSSSAATPPTSPPSWKPRACGPMSSPWTRRERALPRMSSPPSPGWHRSGWSMSPVTPPPWAGT